jgi:hypothetical protein
MVDPAVWSEIIVVNVNKDLKHWDFWRRWRVWSVEFCREQMSITGIMDNSLLLPSMIVEDLIDNLVFPVVFILRKVHVCVTVYLERFDLNHLPFIKPDCMPSIAL